MRTTRIECRKCDRSITKKLDELSPDPEKSVLCTLVCARCTDVKATFYDVKYFDAQRRELDLNDGYVSILP